MEVDCPSTRHTTTLSTVDLSSRPISTSCDSLPSSKPASRLTETVPVELAIFVALLMIWSRASLATVPADCAKLHPRMDRLHCVRWVPTVARQLCRNTGADQKWKSVSERSGNCCRICCCRAVRHRRRCREWGCSHRQRHAWSRRSCSTLPLWRYWCLVTEMPGLRVCLKVRLSHPASQWGRPWAEHVISCHLDRTLLHCNVLCPTSQRVNPYNLYCTFVCVCCAKLTYEIHFFQLFYSGVVAQGRLSPQLAEASSPFILPFPLPSFPLLFSPSISILFPFYFLFPSLSSFFTVAGVWGALKLPQRVQADPGRQKHFDVFQL